jgi:hypothetical protein
MRYADPGALTLEQAKIVALKVLRDTIETSCSASETPDRSVRPPI